jgi:transposase InsO family protein
VQYACDAYQKLLQDYQALFHEWQRQLLRQCHHGELLRNAQDRSGYHEKYATREEARRSIFQYIEVFYNRKRRHSSLGYKSPEAFEAGLN